MYKKTFEVLAKWIASEYNVKIVFDEQDGAGHAELNTNTIHLPHNIANSNALSALALLMHEAAHLAHSKILPMKDLVKDQEDHMILNAIEDIRIDYLNFNKLPNIRTFYEQLVKDHIDLTKSQAPKEITALCGAILNAEGFSPKATPEVSKIMNDATLINALYEGRWNIGNKAWPDVKKNIASIKKFLGLKSTPLTQQQLIAIMGVGECKDGQKGNAPGDGNGDKGKKGALSGGEGDSLTDKLNGILRPSSGYGTGDGMKGNSSDIIGELAFEELTVSQFKEILNLKERKIIPDGMVLDTDNLVSYFTGDIDDLFKEESVVKNKKSKIMFLIDASGSMGAPLLDQKQRWDVVRKSVKSLINILKEVKDTESLDIDWEVCGFTYCFHSYNDWEKEYTASGGTSLVNGCRGAFEKMSKDFTIEGKRILIVFSDGDVHAKEIEEVGHMIQSFGQDIRTLVIGVGTDFSTKFSRELIGDNIIFAEEDANNVILETVKSML